MPQVPHEFSNEFSQKEDTFFRIAELLYTNPDRQYTQSELAEKMDCSNTTISKHTGEMEEWLSRQDSQTTYAWDSKIHNPASTEGLTAIQRFYADLGSLLKKHTSTTPGTFAVVGFAMILAAVVVFAFYVGLSFNFASVSAIPSIVFLVISVGSVITGLIVTFLSPLQAILNRLLSRVLSRSLFQREK